MDQQRQEDRTEVRYKSHSAKIDTLLLYGTFGLLMFGPLAFGAVEPWSIFVVEVGAVLLSALWLAKQWLDGEINLLRNPLFLPMAAFAGLIALQLLLRRSAYPHDSISEALIYVAFAVLCFMANQSLLQ